MIIYSAAGAFGNEGLSLIAKWSSLTEGNLAISNKTHIYPLTKKSHFWEFTLKIGLPKYKTMYVKGYLLFLIAKTGNLKAHSEETS